MVDKELTELEVDRQSQIDLEAYTWHYPFACLLCRAETMAAGLKILLLVALCACMLQVAST